MELIEGFVRQECLVLAECSSNRLSYLERTGLIEGKRFGSNKKPTVVFTWEQLLLIRLTKNLRQDVTSDAIKTIADYVVQGDIDEQRKLKQLVLLDRLAFWVNPDWSDFAQQAPAFIEAIESKGQGVKHFNLIIIPPFVSLINDIWVTAQTPEAGRVINFESFRRRAKATPS